MLASTSLHAAGIEHTLSAVSYSLRHTLLSPLSFHPQAAKTLRYFWPMVILVKPAVRGLCREGV